MFTQLFYFMFLAPLFFLFLLNNNKIKNEIKTINFLPGMKKEEKKNRILKHKNVKKEKTKCRNEIKHTNIKKMCAWKSQLYSIQHSLTLKNKGCLNRIKKGAKRRNLNPFSINIIGGSHSTQEYYFIFIICFPINYIRHVLHTIPS